MTEARYCRVCHVFLQPDWAHCQHPQCPFCRACADRPATAIVNYLDGEGETP